MANDSSNDDYDNDDIERGLVHHDSDRMGQ